MSKRAWMVRAGEGGWFWETNLEEKVASIGWLQQDDLSNITEKEQLRPLLTEWVRWWSSSTSEELSMSNVPNWMGQIWRFIGGIQQGDILMFKSNEVNKVFLGYATGVYVYDDSEEFSTHKQKVESWISVDWKDFSKAARRSLGTPLTVYELTKYIDEFEALMRGEAPAPMEETVPDELEEIQELQEELEERLEEQSFRMEKQLQDFLVDNWDKTELAREWELYRENGKLVGKEFETGAVGRIDLLAQARKGLGWLVIELKRGQTSDKTVGQVQRYMGWVMHNLADEETPVKGLIICFKATDKLHYALDILPKGLIEVMEYGVNFYLKPTNH